MMRCILCFAVAISVVQADPAFDLKKDETVEELMHESMAISADEKQVKKSNPEKFHEDVERVMDDALAGVLTIPDFTPHGDPRTLFHDDESSVPSTCNTEVDTYCKHCMNSASRLHCLARHKEVIPQQCREDAAKFVPFSCSKDMDAHCRLSDILAGMLMDCLDGLLMFGELQGSCHDQVYAAKHAAQHHWEEEIQSEKALDNTMLALKNSLSTVAPQSLNADQITAAPQAQKFLKIDPSTTAPLAEEAAYTRLDMIIDIFKGLIVVLCILIVVKTALPRLQRALREEGYLLSEIETTKTKGYGGYGTYFTEPNVVDRKV